MTQAAEPMTRKVFVVPPELSLSAAWDLMCRERFRHLPVVSGQTLVGILSDRDILVRASLQDGHISVPDTPAGEAATPWPCVCEPTTDVCDLVRMMIEKKIDAVPVVNGANQLVGLVTSTDLLLLLIPLEEAKIPLPFLFELERHSAVDVTEARESLCGGLESRWPTRRAKRSRATPEAAAVDRGFDATSGRGPTTSGPAPTRRAMWGSIPPHPGETSS